MQSTLYAAMAAIMGLAAANQPSDYTEYARYEETSELCAIHAEEHGGSLHLVATAAQGLEGEYVFSLRQSGPNGSGQIMQSGEIESDGYGTTVLSEVSINSDTTYSASLQIYSFDEELTCRALS